MKFTAEQLARSMSRISGPFAVMLLVALALWPALRRPVKADERAASPLPLVYASPLELQLSPDGARLYVLCQQTEEVRVLDARTYAAVKAIPVGHVPRGMALSVSGDRLFVTNSWDDTLSVIDTSALAVIATWNVGAEPSGVVEDRAGNQIFVANRISNDIAVLDARTGVEKKRLLAGRGASYLTLSPDGKRIYATHVYPNATPHRTAPASEITVIDTERAMVVERMPLPGVAGVFHLALSADGRLGAAAEYHPKNLIPLAHLEHGGAFAYTLTLFGADVGKPVEIPLDELERYASQPFGVAISPDKSRLYVTAGGSECVLAIDVARLLRFVHTRPRPASGSFANDLSASANYIVTRIPVGHNPRGLAFSPDGHRLYVANRLEDTISIIDPRTNRVTSTVALDGPKVVSATAPRRTNLLHGALLVSGADRLRKLPYRFHLRWIAVGSGAGWVRARHCRQPADRGPQRHGALQVERRQSRHTHRMRTAHGNVFLALRAV
jgi:YVTN family beta-propeller protein